MKLLIGECGGVFGCLYCVACSPQELMCLGLLRAGQSWVHYGLHPIKIYRTCYPWVQAWVDFGFLSVPQFCMHGFCMHGPWHGARICGPLSFMFFHWWTFWEFCDGYFPLLCVGFSFVGDIFGRFCQWPFSIVMCGIFSGVSELWSSNCISIYFSPFISNHYVINFLRCVIESRLHAAQVPWIYDKVCYTNKGWI